MPKFSFTLDVAAAPAEVIGKMTDFSDRRPKTVMARIVSAFMQVSNGAPIKKSYYTVYGKVTA